MGKNPHSDMISPTVPHPPQQTYRALLMDGSSSLRFDPEFLARVIDNFPHGSLNVLDRELRVLFSAGGGYREAGLQPEFFIGKTVRELTTPDALEDVLHYCDQVFDGKTVEFELLFGGNVYRVIATPLERREDRVWTILVVSQNMTYFNETDGGKRWLMPYWGWLHSRTRRWRRSHG